jgi:hypothetical protein
MELDDDDDDEDAELSLPLFRDREDVLFDAGSEQRPQGGSGGTPQQGGHRLAEV